MRKIRIFEHISLDGVIQHENSDGFAHGGWTAPYRTPAGGGRRRGTGQELRSAAWPPHLRYLGGFWPKAGNSPMANGLNAATKYVATHRPESLEWGPVGELGADIIAGIRGIKSTDGPDLIVWGSSTLTSVLLGAGTGRRGCADRVPGVAGAGQTVLFGDVPTRANSLSSARRPHRRACSSTLIDTWERCLSLAAEKRKTGVTPPVQAKRLDRRSF